MMTEYPKIPKAQQRGYSEGGLANMVGDYLRGRIQSGRSVIRAEIPFPNVTFTCVANERTSEAEGAKFKRRGAMPGVPDYMFWFDNNGHGVIEIKDEDGTLSDGQKEFRYRITQHGHHWALCRTVWQVRDVLVSWGLECKNVNCIEPAGSFEAKVAALHNFNKPYKP